MITYHRLQEDDFKGAVDCAFTAFTQGDPVLRALDVKDSEFRYFLEVIVRQAIIDGFSVVAKDHGNVVGSILSEDIAGIPPAGSAHISDNLAPIFDMLEQLEKQYLGGEKPVAGKYYHMLMGSVYNEYSGNKVTEHMLAKAEEFARNAGFTTSFVEATSPPSQFIFSKRTKYRERARLSYADYRFNGSKPFAGINEVSHCILFDKPL